MSLDLVDLVDSIKKIITHDVAAFSQRNDDILIYGNSQLAYDILLDFELNSHVKTKLWHFFILNLLFLHD